MGITKEDMRQAKIMRLVEAIGNDLAPWERDDYDMNTIIETLENDPLVVVEWLVDRFIEQ